MVRVELMVFGIDDLNLEGAVIKGDRLVFLQRGNKGRGVHALIAVHLSQVLALPTAGDVIGELAFDSSIWDRSMVRHRESPTARLCRMVESFSPQLRKTRPV